MVSSFDRWVSESSRQGSRHRAGDASRRKEFTLSGSERFEIRAVKNQGDWSMRKVYLVCSLLLAFTTSMFGMGCDGGKPAATEKKPDAPKTDAPKTDAKAEPAKTDEKKEEPKKEEPKKEAAKADGEKPAVAETKKPTRKSTRKPKTPGAGSTTGGGVEVPTPAGGTTEKPEEKKAEEKKEEAKPEAKAEEKTEEKKPEEKKE